MNIYNYLLEEYKLSKNPINLFESFSGIGTQAMALKKLGLKINHVGISEIDLYAIKSYKSIHGDVFNYGDITKIDGSILPQIDIFTWSFPCTDLSKAGKQKGLYDTRSGLAFEVIRILSEMKHKPKILLMENVPDLLSKKFKDGWREIYNQIEDLGYTNHVDVLNSKDYGVAQNRNRVFMVSILGEYSYQFPKMIKLEKRLKDYLEDQVESKYYLSDKFITCMMKDNTGSYKRKQIFLSNINISINERIATTITTRETNVPNSNFIAQTICLNSKVNGKQPSLQDRVYDADGVSTSITTSFMPSIAIPEATIQGYALAEDGDGVYINRPHQKRGVVQKGMIQTIKTSSQDIGVIDNLRIRKLTPLECWRLMGISDEDFEKASKVCSNSQLYKQAGNAIVVDVLYHIFKKLIN